VTSFPGIVHLENSREKNTTHNKHEDHKTTHRPPLSKSHSHSVTELQYATVQIDAARCCLISRVSFDSACICPSSYTTSQV
jgi:hypothetical protein